MQVRQRKAEDPGSWMSCVEGALRTLKKSLQCDKGTGLELGKERSGEPTNGQRNDCRGRGRVRGCYVMLERTARENLLIGWLRLRLRLSGWRQRPTPNFISPPAYFPNSMSGRPILFVAAKLDLTGFWGRAAAFHLTLFFKQTFFPLLPSHSAGPLDRFPVRTLLIVDRGSVLPFVNNLATFLAS
ncbi:hypothetical protein BC826DRAFT_370886 [Russula brevipes]|nr:hypothetical protein BC826DRAFT_370886 [Russula brevipes]